MTQAPYAIYLSGGPMDGYHIETLGLQTIMDFPVAEDIPALVQKTKGMLCYRYQRTDQYHEGELVYQWIRQVIRKPAQPSKP